MRRASLLIAVTKSGASGLAKRVSMMPFGLDICQATWCRPGAAAVAAAAAAGAIFACKVSAAVHGCAAVRAIVIGIRNVVKRP